MSNWTKLNSFRAIPGTVAVPEFYWSLPEDGFNGVFLIPASRLLFRVIAGDGGGWQHVSVSIDDVPRCPNWQEMCMIKDLFWEPEDVVVQFHPKKSEYVNLHPHVLHLWRCIDGREFPTPPPIMVGPKAN